MKTTVKFILIFALALSSKTWAGGYDQPAWYVSFDVAQIKSKLVPVVNASTKNKSNDFSLEVHVPEEVSHVTLYGAHNDGSSTTAILSGDMRHFSVISYLDFLASEVGESHPVSLLKTTEHNNKTINHFQVKEGDKSKVFYSSHLNDSTLLVSFSESEILDWVDGKHTPKALHQTSLIAVEVNIDSAMVHAGADLEHQQQPFQSQVFKKINRLAASAIESKDQILVEAALITSDAQTATQVQTVINGLIAMNALSDVMADKADLKAMLENLSVSTDDNQVQLYTQFPLALIADMDID